VCQTFITNTKDLIVVVRKEDTYRVLMLDLDGINSGEGEVDENCFKFQQILHYQASQVNHKDLTSIFARGSSRKEVI
jgi:hypothetical protein